MKKITKKEEKEIELVMWKQLAKVSAPILEKMLEINKRKDEEIKRLKEETKKL